VHSLSLRCGEIRSDSGRRRKWQSSEARRQRGDAARMSFKGCTRRAAPRRAFSLARRVNEPRRERSRMRISIVIPSKGAKRTLALSHRCVVVSAPVTSRSWRNRYATNTIRLVGAAYRPPQSSLVRDLGSADSSVTKCCEKEMENKRDAVSASGKHLAGIAASGPNESPSFISHVCVI